LVLEIKNRGQSSMGKMRVGRLAFLFITISIASCTLLTNTDKDLGISIASIQNYPTQYEGQLISISGYGILTAEVILCPGHVGLDPRSTFVDWNEDKIITQAPKSLRHLHHNGLRRFDGYVRVYRGEMGCPGETSEVIVPYLEIIGTTQP
jgi:hypothetical protein